MRQDEALSTNSIKANIDKQPVLPQCRLDGTKEESVLHLVSSFPNWYRNITKEDCQKSTFEVSQKVLTGKLRQVV